MKEKMEDARSYCTENQSITITKDNTPIHIIGIDDHYSGHSDVDKAFAEVPDEGIQGNSDS